MSFFVTVDENNVVQEVYDSANGNVPVGALLISNAEFTQLSAEGSFDLFKHENGILVENITGIEIKLKTQLVILEEQKVLADLISTPMIPKLVQINNMNATALKAAIAAGGLA